MGSTLTTSLTTANKNLFTSTPLKVTEGKEQIIEV